MSTPSGLTATSSNAPWNGLPQFRRLAVATSASARYRKEAQCAMSAVTTTHLPWMRCPQMRDSARRFVDLGVAAHSPRAAHYGWPGAPIDGMTGEMTAATGDGEADPAALHLTVKPTMVACDLG